MTTLTKWKWIIVVGAIVAVFARGARAEDKRPQRPKIEPGIELEDGWEKRNPRYEHLMIRLAIVETMLDEVEKRQYGDYWRRKQKEVVIKTADKETVKFLKNGGGPTRWNKFYGQTIDAFYQPGGSRTAAIFDSWGNPVAASVTQGAPQLVKRPPQFDFIEKSRDKLRADAARDVNLLAKNLDKLEARRKELELEQIELWCQIAFREVQRRDLAQKSFYRFEPVSQEIDSSASKYLEGMREAVLLMSKVVRIVDKAEEDQAAALKRIAVTVKGARVHLKDTWQRCGVLKVTISNEEPDIATNTGRFLRLTKFLEDHGRNLEQSYAAGQRDTQNRDESKLDDKKRNWEEMMNSMVRFAEVVIAMDETAIKLAAEWKFEPNLNATLVLEPPPPKAGEPAGASVASPATQSTLLGLREIRMANKEGSLSSQAVTCEDGVTYIARSDGSKTPLTLSGRNLTWTGPKGAKRVVNVDNPATSGAQLIYDDGQTSAQVDKKPQNNKKKKGKGAGKGSH